MTRRRGSRSRTNPHGPRPAGRDEQPELELPELGIEARSLEQDSESLSAVAASNGRPLRILWIGTKSPWPPVDGGRLVALNTLHALAEAGHKIVFIAPVEGSNADRAEVADALRDICEPVLTKPRHRPALDDALHALVGRQPVTIRRHFRAKVAAAVAGRLATGQFDVVHCEQLHSVTQATPALAMGVPVVLRQQNVESDLWTMMARQNVLLRPLLLLEASRVRRYEAHVMRRVALTVALTARDAERLQAIGGAGTAVRAVRAPFAGRLAPGPGSLAGDPPVVLFGDQRWQPNRLQTLEFVGGIWPRVQAALPEARLHLMGGELRRSLLPGAARRAVEGVDVRPAPADSRDAYVPGSVLVVPLRVASGVRMKILEAWARGIPVVATSAAAGGLESEDGRELLLADDADGFARALARLQAEPELRRSLVEAGRAALAARHAPSAIAAELAATYAAAAGQQRS
jgi:glycosyltransferase involved in cell wall biosynthesis